MSIKNLTLTVEVSSESLVESMIDDADHDALIELIKDIDLRIADWDFTLKLCDYFANQRETYDQEAEAAKDDHEEMNLP